MSRHVIHMLTSLYFSFYLDTICQAKITPCAFTFLKPLGLNASQGFSRFRIIPPLVVYIYRCILYSISHNRTSPAGWLYDVVRCPGRINRRDITTNETSSRYTKRCARDVFYLTFWVEGRRKFYAFIQCAIHRKFKEFPSNSRKHSPMAFRSGTRYSGILTWKIPVESLEPI